MSQVTEQSVRFQTALASIKLIQASAVLDLTEDDFDFLTSNKVWIATDRSRARRCVEACVYGTLDFVGYPRFPAPVEFIAAVIAYYVHPVNIQTACLIMEGAEFTENIINGVERPNRYKLITNVRSSLMAVNIHITIIELNALHTKRQNLFQELDAVIHLLMEAKHWGLRKSRNATSLNSRFKSLDTLKVKIISVTFRRVIRTNHKKASKIWRHENIQLGGCQS